MSHFSKTSVCTDQIIMYIIYVNLHFILREALVFSSPTLKVYLPWSSFFTSLTHRLCLPRREDITYFVLGVICLFSKNQVPSASSRDSSHSNSPEYDSGTSTLSKFFTISSGAPSQYKKVFFVNTDIVMG